MTPKNRKWKMIVALSCLLVLALFASIYQPMVFRHHALLNGDKITGEVFRKSSDNFLVRLTSGIDLLVAPGERSARLLTGHRAAGGIRVGPWLICSGRKLHGVDLSVTEGFEKQVPEIQGNYVSLRDPTIPDGTFRFPLQATDNE